MSSGKVLVAQGGGPPRSSTSRSPAWCWKRGATTTCAWSTARATACAASSTRTLSTSRRRPATTWSWWRHAGFGTGFHARQADRAYCLEIFKVLQAHRIEHFFYIGGNDSSDTVRIVSEEAQKAGYPLRSIHIPKDHRQRPGGQRPHAGLPVGGALRGPGLRRRQPGQRCAARRLRRRGDGPPRGFLTAASALGKKFPDDGPHLIYLPEREFEIDKFLADVKAVYERHGRCMIAVSEGIHDASGAPMLAKLAKDLEHDAHGNVQLSAAARWPTCCARRSRTS